MILRLVDAWQGYTRRHPVLAMLTLALLFTLAVLVMHATASSYDNNNETMPGTMIGAIIALYLGATFVIGLVTPMKVGAVGPVLAYPVATFIWYLISGGAYDRATYDSGWVGAVLYPLAPTAFIWLAAYIGRVLGGPLEERPQANE